VSKGTRRIALGKSVMGLVLALFLAGLLLTATACEDLIYTSPTVAAVVETATTIPVSTTQLTTTTSTEATGTGAGAHTGPSTEETATEVTLLLYAQAFSTTTERAPTHFHFAEQHDGHAREIHVGDFVTVSLTLHPAADITTRVAVPDPQIMEFMDEFVSSGIIYMNFEAMAPGSVRLQAIYVYDDGTFAPGTWTYDLSVTE
jgi:hypothetical protein